MKVIICSISSIVDDVDKQFIIKDHFKLDQIFNP